MHAAGLAVLVLLTGAPDVPQTAAPAAAAAAAPATAPAVAPAAPTAAAPAEAPPPVIPENYTYDPSGRRDPFLSLLGQGTDAHQPSSRKSDGPAGMTVAEISVRGVLQGRNGVIAMVQGPDNKTYIVHAGDKLADGSIKSITAQGLVIEQAVNDPLSVVKQREVRKLLRGLEDSK